VIPGVHQIELDEIQALGNVPSLEFYKMQPSTFRHVVDNCILKNRILVACIKITLCIFNY